jgi:PAS domain S-box-containing protein
MKTLLQRLISTPSLDPDDSRRRRNLNILLIGTECALILAFIASLVAFSTGRSEKETILITWASASMALVVILVYLINRYWSGKVAAVLFLTFLTIALSFSDSPEQIANGRSLFIYVIPIAMASVILQPVAGFFFALLGSGIVTWLALSISKLPNVPGIGGFFIVALVSWLSARSLEQALNDVREINANLDRLVAQKTQELASALSRELILAGRNEAILNSIADGVIVFDANNIAIRANPALSRLMEIPLQNLVGTRFSELMNSDRLTAASRGTMMGLIERPEKTVPGLRIEWGEKTLSTSFARVQDASGENIGTVAVFRDITREAELEKMKETFVAIVSHELRTPLNAIMGHTEMLKESIYGSLNEKQSTITERIMVNVKRLLGMVGDLLDEAQIRAGKLSIKPQSFRPAHLLEVVHNTMDKIAADKGLTLTSELDPSMPENIIGDPQRLQQVLVNLVNNSVKFTERGGVHVRILRTEPGCWKMEVTDTGAGIPVHEIPHIFETFRQVDNVTTRQHSGFGLGLSIVKQLVELMGGRIEVKSEDQQGSAFTVILPLETTQPRKDVKS